MLRSRSGQLAGILSLFFAASLFACWLFATPSGSSKYVPPPEYAPGLPIAGKTSIIIPAYHEADSLRTTINALRHEPLPSYEIIVVDDNSQDGTDKVVNKYNVLDGMEVRLITRTNASGLSSAVLDGMAAARGEFFVVMDADGQHPPVAVQALLRTLTAIPRAKIGLGARRKVDNEWPWHRRLISWGATALARPLVGTQVRDPMTGLFAIRSEVFHRAAAPLNTMGFKVALELLLKSVLVPENFEGVPLADRVVQMPYDFKAREKGASKLGVKVIVQYIIQLFSLYYYKMGLTLPIIMCLGATAVLYIAMAFLALFRSCWRSRRRYERLGRTSSETFFESDENGSLDQGKEHRA